MVSFTGKRKKFSTDLWYHLPFHLHSLWSCGDISVAKEAAVPCGGQQLLFVSSQPPPLHGNFPKSSQMWGHPESPRRKVVPERRWLRCWAMTLEDRPRGAGGASTSCPKGKKLPNAQPQHLPTKPGQVALFPTDHSNSLWFMLFDFLGVFTTGCISEKQPNRVAPRYLSQDFGPDGHLWALSQSLSLLSLQGDAGCCRFL